MRRRFYVKYQILAISLYSLTLLQASAQGLVLSPAFGINASKVALPPFSRNIERTTSLGVDASRVSGDSFTWGISYLWMQASLNQDSTAGTAAVNEIDFHSLGLSGSYNFCSSCRLQPILYASLGVKMGYPVEAGLTEFQRSTKWYLDLDFGVNYQYNAHYGFFALGGIGRTQLRVGLNYLVPHKSADE